MDKLRAMASFVRIVEKGSLTSAAADLGMSLPSVVRTLAALERDLGATLLTRTTRRLNLTEEGRQYLGRCRIILGQVHEAEASFVTQRAEPHGRIGVTAPVMFGRRYVAAITNEFVQHYPAVTAELLFVDRMVNLVEEGVDVAVRIGRLADSSLVAVPVAHVRRVVCASPAYLRKHGTPRHPNDLREHRFVRFTGLAPRPEWHFRIGARRGTDPRHNTGGLAHDQPLCRRSPVPPGLLIRRLAIVASKVTRSPPRDRVQRRLREQRHDRHHLVHRRAGRRRLVGRRGRPLPGGRRTVNARACRPSRGNLRSHAITRGS